MSLGKLKNIATLKNDQALAKVNAAVSRQVEISGKIGEILEKIEAQGVKAAMEDQYLLDKWFIHQQKRLGVLLRLQSDLELQIKQAKKKAYTAIARRDVIEKIHAQDTRNRIRKVASRKI